MPRNITLPPLTDYVSLADVPLLLAQSIDRKDCEDPELFQAFDAIAYEKEVKDAVLWGQLLPRSPNTLIPIPQACGEQLRTAVVTVANLAEFVKQRYEGLVQVEGGTTGERTMAQEATKKENGRYTLEEAASMLAEHAGMRFESALSKLIEAVEREELPVYEPGRNETYQPKTVREFYEEAYWNDLNAWLKLKEPRIGYEFPEPSTSTKSTPQVDKRGVTKQEILSVTWPTASGAPPLENILKNIPKWAEEACTKVGRRGKGAGGSHLWNPAVLAVCLATTSPQKGWKVSKTALDRIIRSNFEDYLSEWEKASEHL